MPPASVEPSAVPPDAPDEAALAALSPGLLAQPQLWRTLAPPSSAPLEPAAAPWTTYWRVRQDVTRDPADARALLVAAFEAMGRAGDRLGELACLAAVIEGFYVEEGSLEALDRHIAALEERLPADGQWPTLEFEAHVMACGVGIRLRAENHPLLARWAARGAVLMRQVRPGVARLKLATFLAQYHFWRGEIGRVGLIVDALPGLDEAGLLPSEALVWLETLALHARASGQPARGLQAIERALDLVQRHGLGHHVYALHAHGAALALAAGDTAAARAHIDGMRPVLDRRPQADQTHYWHFQAGLALAQGEPARAIELARAALQNAGEIGGPTRALMQQLSLGQALLAAGRPAQALGPLGESLAAARAIEASLVAFSAGLMQAATLLELGRDDEARAPLAAAWTEGARHDFAVTAGWQVPQALARAAAAALEQGIETGYVRRFVRRQELPGPGPTCAAWPWPLVLRGFGAFEALHDEAPLTRSGGKTAQRPLDLLRALLAHGGGALPVATAMQWLWPEADPAARRKAFDVALLRLRRLLDDARLLRLDGGRLELDPRWCWSDVAALAALLHEIGDGRGAGLWQLQAWAHRLLDLMRGPFLAGEDADWVLAARTRLRRRFVVSVDLLASRLAPLDGSAARQLYERALDAEPLAETLSRRLMQLHAERGDRAEALRVWRACRAQLQAAEGLAPARETQALATALGLDDAG